MKEFGVHEMLKGVRLRGGKMHFFRMAWMPGVEFPGASYHVMFAAMNGNGFFRNILETLMFHGLTPTP